MAATWAEMLSPATLATVLELAAEAGAAGARRPTAPARPMPDRPMSTERMADALAAFHFPDAAWARVVYDLIARPRPRRPPRPIERYVAALVPIYFGRVGSFVIENRKITTDEAEERVERQAREFELLKPYLVERWAELHAAGVRDVSRTPLPARILIPVANPGTAEELVRIGAALLDPRAGELDALGIVEVPEGMPLSEGATRARHARRLLQRVLDYAPAGTTIHPLVRIGRHAAEGIVEAAAEQEADLIIFGWGGKQSLPGPAGDGLAAGAPAGRGRRASRTGDGVGSVFSPTIDAVVRESPCDIVVVKQRGATRSAGSSSRSAAGPTPSWP